VVQDIVRLLPDFTEPRGKSVIFAAACLLLAGQIWEEIGLYWRGDWLAFARDLCVDVPRNAMLQWWTTGVLTLTLIVALVFSLRRYKSLGQKWWYLALPFVVVATTVSLYFGSPDIACSWHATDLKQADGN